MHKKAACAALVITRCINDDRQYGCLDIFILAAKAAANHHKEYRKKKIASTVAVTIPPITPVPTGSARRNQHQY